MAYSADTLAYEVISEMAVRELTGPVFVLGKKYILPKEKESLTGDIRSRIWCTYRRNFRPISGTNLSSDSGWGCTLRCGQMLLAQALLCKRLGREYQWIPGYNNPPYTEILRKFLDVRDSEYSIQMIALQGADFGRSVGQWFGPNNVAQAIKRLAAYDHSSQLAVHVAMDMLVVIDDLKATACEPHTLPTSPVNVTDENGDAISLRSRSLTDTSALSPTSDSKHRHPHSSTFTPGSQREQQPDSSPRGGAVGGVAYPDPVATSSPFDGSKCSPVVGHNAVASTGVTYLNSPPYKDVAEEALASPKHVVIGDELDFMKLSFRLSPTHMGTSAVNSRGNPSPMGMASCSTASSASSETRHGKNFRSILLFIPLRLGQDTFNPTYAEALKACLTLPQSVGFIGGRPRHALYFIGYNNNTLLYLDPHTTQATVDAKEGEPIPDSTYHTANYGRMNISGLDPSIALGFFCKDENDVDDLVKKLKKFVLKDSTLNMFELTEHRPAYWGPFQSSSLHTSIKEPFILLNERHNSERDNSDCDSEEGFEIIEWPPEWPPIGLPTHFDPTYSTGHATHPGAKLLKSKSIN